MHEPTGWEIAVYVAHDFSAPQRKFVALAFDGGGEPMPLSQFGPTADFVRLRLEAKLIDAKAKARDIARGRPTYVDPRLGEKLRQRARDPAKRVSG